MVTSMLSRATTTVFRQAWTKSVPSHHYFPSRSIHIPKCLHLRPLHHIQYYNQLNNQTIHFPFSKRNLVQCLSFSTSSSSTNGVMSEDWAEHEFIRMADLSLEHVSEVISAIGYDDSNSNATQDEFDVDLSQGVLTIKLGPVHGTYVLNTQTPNRQIWMSSPVSGPWRYAWHPTHNDWISTRDGHSLSQRLSEELGNVFDVTVEINFPV